MEIRKVENKSLLQGDNEFETGIIMTVKTIPAGAFLKRMANGRFAIVTDTGNEEPVAVNPVEIPYASVQNSEANARVLIGGKVRFDMLNVDGRQITEVEGDMIRKYGIVPKKVTDLSWTRE